MLHVVDKETTAVQRETADFCVIAYYTSCCDILTLARMVSDNNVTADVDFVMVPYSYVTDSTVVVSKEEIQTYIVVYQCARMDK